MSLDQNMEEADEDMNVKDRDLRGSHLSRC
jgi:hypothetical protein